MVVVVVDVDEVVVDVAVVLDVGGVVEVVDELVEVDVEVVVAVWAPQAARTTARMARWTGFTAPACRTR